MASSDDVKVKLIGAWPSPYDMRARIALKIKSIDYQFIAEDFRQKSELLNKVNPVYKKIPVLIHGEKPICESLIIVQYIDEVWSNSGPSILPYDPYDRAISRFWATYIDDKWFPALKGIAVAEGEEARQAAISTVAEGFALLEEAFLSCSNGKDFFGGEKIGYLDIAFGSFLAWLKVTENMNNLKLLDEAKTPNLAKWAEKFRADASVKDAMPETEKLIQFAKAYIGKMRANNSQK